MAVPKQRKTKSRRNQRRSHLSLKAPSLIKCPKCGKLILPHIVCPECGFYKGKEVIDVLSKLDKKGKKEKKGKIEEKEQKKKELDIKSLSRRK